MKKAYLILTINLSILSAAQTGGVGINTQNPERTLHIQGDMRSTIFQNKGNDSLYEDLIISNSSGNIDKQPKSSVFQTPTQQVETDRNIYYNTTSGDINKIAKCGKFTFAINNSNIPVMKLNVQPSSNITYNYGLRRLERRTNLTGGHSANTGDGDYYYNNKTITFTSTNWDTYQKIFDWANPGSDSAHSPSYPSGEQHLLNNDFLKLHLIDPETGDFYKIEFLRMINQKSSDVNTATYNLKNTSNAGMRVVLCERYYKQ